MKNKSKLPKYLCFGYICQLLKMNSYLPKTQYAILTILKDEIQNVTDTKEFQIALSDEPSGLSKLFSGNKNVPQDFKNVAFYIKDIDKLSNELARLQKEINVKAITDEIFESFFSQESNNHSPFVNSDTFFKLKTLYNDGLYLQFFAEIILITIIQIPNNSTDYQEYIDNLKTEKRRENTKIQKQKVNENYTAINFFLAFFERIDSKAISFLKNHKIISLLILFLVINIFAIGSISYESYKKFLLDINPFKSSVTKKNINPKLLNEYPNQSNQAYRVTKQFRKNKKDKWSDIISLQKDEAVYIRIHFENISDISLDNVTIKDVTPKGLTYTANSTVLYNSSNPKGLTVPDGLLGKTGINVGKYNVSGDAYIVFKCSVDSDIEGKVTLADNHLTEISYYNQETKETLVSNIWGPNRDIFLDDNSTFITLNSLYNEKEDIDERLFVLGNKVHEALNAKLGRDILLKESGEYWINLYVCNNSEESLDLIAESVTAQLYIPEYIAKEIKVYGYLYASNAKPEKIFSSMTFRSEKDFKLSYIKGSAKFTNQIFNHSTILSDNIVSNSPIEDIGISDQGVLLGYTKLDGSIPGGLQYSGWVHIKVKADVYDFKINSRVAISDKLGVWKNEVEAKPGDEVDYQIEFNNTSPNTLDNVILDFNLPPNCEIIKDSVYITGPRGSKNINHTIVDGGLNIGSYQQNEGCLVEFKVKISEKASSSTLKELKCIVSATTLLGKKSSSTNIILDNSK